MVSIAGYELAEVVRQIEIFAHAVGVAGRRVTYVKLGDELVAERRVRESAVLVLRAAKAERDAVKVELPLEADSIKVAYNVRVMGLARLRGVTAKIQLGTWARRPSVLREVRARQAMAPLIDDPMVGVPALRDWDHDRHRWLVEDFVAAQEVGEDDLRRFVIDHAGAAYSPSARQRKMKRSPSRRRVVEALEGVLHEIAPRFPPVGNDATWPVGLIHNDLTTQNLLRDAAGKFWLIDWEHAGVVPLVSDLGRVYIRLPDLKDALVGVLAALDRDGTALPPKHQLALGGIRMLQRHVEARAIRARGVALDRRGNWDAVRALDAVIAAERAAIAALAD